MVRSTVCHCGARSKLDRTILVPVNTWRIGGMGYFEHDRHARFQPVGNHLHPRTADFLLYGIDCEDGCGRAGILNRKVHQHLREDEATDPVVNRSTNDPTGYQLFCGIGVNSRVTDAYSSVFNLTFRFRSDVQVQLVYLRNFVALFIAKMNCDVSDDAQYRDLPPNGLDAFAACDRAGTAANSSHIH